MVKRFLLILFDVFIGFVVFVSLFQFSAAHLNLGGLENQFNSDNYFGFYSLFSFTSDLGNNTEFVDAWDDAISWFTQVISWLTKNIQNSWNSAINSASSNNIFQQAIDGIKLLFLLLSSPVVLVVGLLGFIGYVFRFLWIVVTMFAKLLTGYYNIPIVHSGYISSFVSSFNGVYSF